MWSLVPPDAGRALQAAARTVSGLSPRAKIEPRWPAGRRRSPPCGALGATPAEAEHASPAATDYRDRYEILTGRSLRRCPCCHDGNMHPVDSLAGEWDSPAIQDSS